MLAEWWCASCRGDQDPWFTVDDNGGECPCCGETDAVITLTRLIVADEGPNGE